MHCTCTMYSIHVHTCIYKLIFETVSIIYRYQRVRVLSNDSKMRPAKLKRRKSASKDVHVRVSKVSFYDAYMCIYVSFTPSFYFSTY